MRAKLDCIVNLKNFMAQKMETKLKNDNGDYTAGKIETFKFKKFSELFNKMFKQQLTT